MVCYRFLGTVEVMSVWIYFIDFRRLWFYLYMEISLPPASAFFFLNQCNLEF